MGYGHLSLIGGAPSGPKHSPTSPPPLVSRNLIDHPSQSPYLLHDKIFISLTIPSGETCAKEFGDSCVVISPTCLVNQTIGRRSPTTLVLLVIRVSSSFLRSIISGIFSHPFRAVGGLLGQQTAVPFQSNWSRKIIR